MVRLISSVLIFNLVFVGSASFAQFAPDPAPDFDSSPDQSQGRFDSAPPPEFGSNEFPGDDRFADQQPSLRVEDFPGTSNPLQQNSSRATEIGKVAWHDTPRLKRVAKLQAQILREKDDDARKELAAKLKQGV